MALFLYSFIILALLDHTNNSGVSGNRATYLHLFSGTILLLLFIFNDHSLLPDLPDYINYFNVIGETPWRELVNIRKYIYIKEDYGFIYSFKIIHSLFDSEIFLFAVIGVFIIFSYLYFVRMFSTGILSPIFFYLAYSFYENLFLIRQSIAVGILLISLKFLVQQRKLRFFTMICVAFTFHQTSIVMLLVLLMDSLKNYRQLIGVTSVVIILGAYLRKILISSFAVNLDGYETYSQYDLNSSNLVPLFIGLIFLSVLIFYICNENVVYDREAKVIINMAVVFLIIEMLRFGLFGVFGRLNMFFAPCWFIIIPGAVQSIQSRLLRLSFLCAFVSLFVLLYESSMNYGFSLTLAP